MKKLLIGTACVLASGALMAGAMPYHKAMPAGPHGWYAGAGINYSALLSQHTGTPAATVHSKDFNPSFNLFAGYRLTRHFGNELMYSHVGHRQWSSQATNAVLESTHDSWLLQYDALGFIPLNQIFPGFEFFVRAGVDYLYTQGFNADAAAAAAYNKSAKLSTFAWNFGAGLQYNWRMLAARVSYTNYENTLRAADQAFDFPNLVAFDVLYRFG